MSRPLCLALALSCLALAPAAFAQATAPAAAAPAAAVPAASAKLSSETKVRVLLADPKARAILQKHVPLIVEHAPNFPEITDVTLKALSQVEQAQTLGGLTAEVFRKIEADLAAL